MSTNCERCGYRDKSRAEVMAGRWKGNAKVLQCPSAHSEIPVKAKVKPDFTIEVKSVHVGCLEVTIWTPGAPCRLGNSPSAESLSMSNLAYTSMDRWTCIPGACL